MANDPVTTGVHEPVLAPSGGGRLAGLRQKTLFRFAAAYAVAAWLVIQVAATVAPAFDLSPWVVRAVILFAVLGFVATVAYFGFVRPASGETANDLKRTSRMASLAFGGALVVAALAGVGFVARQTLFATEQVSLAVLPFADLSPKRDKAYFAEGVAEEILSTLAAEKGIKVLGRTSARQIERNPDPAEIRARLGITHLLEGSARAAGDQLRVNVRLIDTADGRQLWEEKYQGKPADVFAVQDRIASTVVRRLRGTFGGDGPRRAAETTAIDAYQSYLAARALMRDPKKETLTEAWKLARQIVDAHPNYALGHALYAHTTFLLADDPYSYGDIPVEKARAIAIAHARMAISLAPDRAEGYAALGLSLQRQQSVEPLKKAIALDRSWAALRNNLGIAYNELRRNDEAFQQYQLAVEIDPLSPAINNRYVASLAASGRSREALDAINRYVERGGSEAQAWRYRGATMGLRGDLSGAVAARRRALALDPQLPYQHEWLAVGLHLLGVQDQVAQHIPHISRYFQLFVANDRAALKAQVLRDGAGAWGANGLDSAVFSLARARDWPAIIRFYDARPADQRDLCVTQQRFMPFIIMALRAQGRAGESARLLSCVQASLMAELKMRYRSSDPSAGELEMWQASLLALRGDGRAFDWLAKAMDRGWMGQYYSGSLSDWAQFDSLQGDARYARLQRRMDASIAKERAETLRLFGAPRLS